MEKRRSRILEHVTASGSSGRSSDKQERDAISRIDAFVTKQVEEEFQHLLSEQTAAAEAKMERLVDKIRSDAAVDCQEMLSSFKQTYNDVRIVDEIVTGVLLTMLAMSTAGDTSSHRDTQDCELAP